MMKFRKLANLIIVRGTEREEMESFLLVVFPDGSCVGRWDGICERSGKPNPVKFKGNALQAKMFILNNLCPDNDFPVLEQMGYKIGE